MPKKLTKEEFIEKANKMYNHLYDYNKVLYKNVATKVIVICKRHGEFKVLPNNHLSKKSGCPKCAGNYKCSVIEFVEKSNGIFNNIYDYSNIIYINSKEKIDIICKEHGIFKQTPDYHVRGYGCPNCIKLNKDKFIKKANLIYNSNYDYNNINWINSYTKVDIICKKHGVFKKSPHKHLSGQGCPKCSNNRDTNESFLEKANSKHNYLYDYSNVDYINSITKVDIICKKHGVFKQSPKMHLNGEGCPDCWKSKGELEIESILKKNILNYKKQFWFKDLRHINTLKYDFGILDENGSLKYLIEYNGEQHYKFIKHIHKYYENYEVMKIRDVLKQEYCVKNNIPLFVIKFNENIEEKLYAIIKQ